MCIGIIFASGLWALSLREPEADTQTGGRYGQVQEAERLRLHPPVTGDIAGKYGQAEWLPALGRWGAHEAVDFAAQKGDAVRAAKDGVVDAVYRDALLGGVVEVSHGDGLVTRYCALQWPPSIQKGGTVISGQILGAVGETVMEASGVPHVHFEVWLHGMPVDPALYIEP